MAIDPRIRARRAAVRREEGRRRLRFLVGAMGLVVLAVAGWGLSRSPLLDLDHVRIDGVTGADAVVVGRTAALQTGTPMFDLDLGAVDRAVTALPWVQAATAERDWPGTVRLRVSRREPVAIVGTADGPWFAADAEGVLIADAGDLDLPAVAVPPTAGLGEVDTRALVGVEIAVAIPDDLRPWIEAVTIDEQPGSDGRPVVGLDLIGSATVVLGSVDLIDDKLAAVRALLDSADLTCVDVIDVVVADLTTVTRDPVCEGAADDGGAGDDA